MKTEEHGTVRVRVTSIDARDDHPFRLEDTVAGVHNWAYDRLVKDKAAVPFEATWMEYQGERVDDSRQLRSFDLPDHEPRGKEVALTLGLAWTSQGGI